jgi:hypothetical protein
MTDLREAAQMALDALEHLQTDIEWQYKSPTRAMLRKVEKALRAALAQPKQEPVAWMAKQAERIPQFFEDKKDARVLLGVAESELIPLYTAPPQREWQGLTDEEIDEAHETTISFHGFARAIEAKLKEKNT